MMKRKHVVGLAVGVVLIMLLWLWYGLMPRRFDIVHVGSWSQLELADDIFIIWKLDEPAMTRRIRNHRHDELFVYGKSRTEIIEKVLDMDRYIFFEKESNAALHHELIRCVEELNITGASLVELEKSATWLFRTSLNSGYVVCQYSSSSNMFVAYIMVYRSRN